MKDKYLYVKSRDPAIYTRMHLTDAAIGVDKFNIYSISTATNPYGERVLESINDGLPRQVRGPIYRSIKRAFLQEKLTLPPKPDIKKMMKEFEKTHKRVKDGYGGYEWVEK